MDKEVEVLEAKQIKENHIPKPIETIGAVIIGINALYIGLLGLATVVQVFSGSFIVGIVMLLTVVGFIPFTPMWVGFSALGWFETISPTLSRFEFWTKVVLFFLGGIILPYVASIVANFLTLVIAAFLSSFL